MQATKLMRICQFNKIEELANKRKIKKIHENLNLGLTPRQRLNRAKFLLVDFARPINYQRFSKIKVTPVSINANLDDCEKIIANKYN